MQLHACDTLHIKDWPEPLVRTSILCRVHWSTAPNASLGAAGRTSIITRLNTVHCTVFKRTNLANIVCYEPSTATADFPPPYSMHMHCNKILQSQQNTCLGFKRVHAVHIRHTSRGTKILKQCWESSYRTL